jgi:CheY-like chemotaxis protein
MDRPADAQDVVLDLRAPVQRRPEPAVLHDQVRGIDSWNAARRAREAASAGGGSRESRLDLARQKDVLQRVQEMLIDRTRRQMSDGTWARGLGTGPRVIIVHRNEWFRMKVAAGLEDAGVQVVCALENGADAVGAAVAEQPDLVLLEDRLPMIGAVDVIRWLAEHAPHTTCAVQVGSDHDMGTYLDAGARTAFSRRVPPADVAQALAQLLTGADH